MVYCKCASYWQLLECRLFLSAILSALSGLQFFLLDFALVVVHTVSLSVAPKSPKITSAANASGALARQRVKSPAKKFPRGWLKLGYIFIAEAERKINYSVVGKNSRCSWTSCVS